MFDNSVEFSFKAVKLLGNNGLDGFLHCDAGIELAVGHHDGADGKNDSDEVAKRHFLLRLSKRLELKPRCKPGEEESS